MKKRILFILLALLLMLPLAACGSTDPEEAILGRWECENETVPHTWACTFIFEANGRFVDRDGDVGDWSIDGNDLTLAFDMFPPLTVSFSISRDRLTLTGEGWQGENFLAVLRRR